MGLWHFDSEIHFLETGNVIVLRAPNEEIDKSLIPLGYVVEGAVAEYTWEGELVWEYVFLDPRRRQHHGIEIMPNGNILAIVWDYHHLNEALAAGLDPTIAARLFEEVEVFLPTSL